MRYSSAYIFLSAVCTQTLVREHYWRTGHPAKQSSPPVIMTTVPFSSLFVYLSIIGMMLLTEILHLKLQTIGRLVCTMALQVVCWVAMHMRGGGGQTAEARKTLSEDKKTEILASLSLRRLFTRMAITKLGTLYRDHEQEAGSIRRVI